VIELVPAAGPVVRFAFAAAADHPGSTGKAKNAGFPVVTVFPGSSGDAEVA